MAEFNKTLYKAETSYENNPPIPLNTRFKISLMGFFILVTELFPEQIQNGVIFCGHFSVSAKAWLCPIGSQQYLSLPSFSQRFG